MSDYANDEPLAVVGLGASSGGITALNNFFDVMAPDTGLAFVVILHLNPDFETHVHELLDAHTDMPVVQAESGMPVEADHVYVIAPDTQMSVDDGQLVLQRPRQRGPNKAIDIFFRSLAKQWAPRAAGVVLSGAGADGTLGLQAIQQAGGLTLVQTPNTSGYDSMPRSAMRAGVVDEALPVEQIATRLETFAHYLGERIVGPNTDEDETFAPDYLGHVCEVLGKRVNHDFSQYKRPMLSRRIGRRMMLTGTRTPAQYLELLQDGDAESQALLKDLLISVTAFFRDPAAFDELQDKLDELLDDATNDTLRIWVPGCATGEEAYSIAILAAERIEQMRRRVEVQLFATDIDEKALQKARAGYYDAAQLELQVSRARLERFFVRRGDRYRVRETVRDMCIFSSHDLVSDPPFSRLDLLSCRNVLIYMEPELQQKLLALFHYALRPGGYLFLGPAESIRGRDNLFRVVDSSSKIFRARELPKDIPPSFPVFDQLAKRRHHSPYAKARAELSPHELGRVFQQRLLDRFGPASALVDDNGRVLYFSGHLGRFLEHRSGPVEDHIVELARPELRLHLRTTLHKARSQREEVLTSNVRIAMGDQIEHYDLVVSPLQATPNSEHLWMVVFRPVSTDKPLIDQVHEGLANIDQNEVIDQLEAELEATRDHLESTIAQLETANEELKSSNEELLSMNEELQSSNEEMQTSKVELQSVNQELETVNDTLETKVAELDTANADLMNLFESTRVPTVFLDRELRIKQFTPAAKEIFRLIKADVGRPLADITLRVSGVDLLDEVQNVLETLTPTEVRVESNAEGPQRTYLLRIHPYRTLDDVIDGAVLTFVDVTELEETSRRLRIRETQQACVAKLGVEALSSPHFSQFIQEAVQAVCETLSSDAGGIFRLQDDTQLKLEAGCGWPQDDADAVSLPVEHNSLASYTLRMEGAVLCDDLHAENRFQPSKVVEARRMASSLSCVIHNTDGTYGVLAVYSKEAGAFRDDDANFLVSVANVITSALGRKERLEELHASEERLRAMADTVPVLMWLSEPERAYSWFNKRWLEFTGRDLSQEIDGGWTAGLHPDEREEVIGMHQQTFAERRPLKADFRLRRADGEYRWVSLRAQPWYSPDGSYMGSIGACIDVTDRREFEQALQRADELKDEFLAMLGHELRNPLAAITTAVDLLDMLAVDNDELGKIHDILDRQSEHMKRLLDGLLDVTRIERGKMRLQHEIFDLNDLITHVVDDWRSRIEHAQINLKLHIDEAPLWTSGDRTRLMQVVNNLLSNAVKFTEAPGRICVESRTERDMAVLQFRDTGAGIAPEAFEAIFEPFRQAEQTIDRSEGGLGMGLPLAKGLVEAHGGTITVESDGPGEGSTFTVRLPLSEPPVAASAHPRSASESQRIMVVEDNEDAGALIETVLEHRGHHVLLCRSGAEALDKAAEFQPQVVLCDIGLPGGIDGFEVARRLRSNPSFDNTMLVAMTGYGRHRTQDESLEAGFDAHLVKPVDLKTIEQVLSPGSAVPTDVT
ncbi:PAS domain S-box protein [Persicimonas caeni]|uniref:histidine kinase n=1 Tax=Persicimonas caeni TaxID=2292766 RepID=A0A4Y6PXD3_PERCE|nr:chemotaxis protein CheB [Persicimonas caeni]QDG52994.1 PAS domain S-box protein [Persicimonas caeni]QED34216.1 PAS domain S-box protein [Persicimonas caeni]